VKPAAFLDRDGVINVDSGYVHAWEDYRFLPGVFEALRALEEAGYALVIVTNQSGIARKLYSEAAYQALTMRLRQALAERGVRLTGIYHCPHHPDGVVPALSFACSCRKPAPGMLLQAAAEHALDLASSVLIGDRDSDLQAGRNAGVGRNFLIAPAPVVPAMQTNAPDGCFPDLKACVAHLLHP
jgi:D-glycero-D-manno-heptose 1,7-bisphosphate phosphatase